MLASCANYYIYSLLILFMGMEMHPQSTCLQSYDVTVLCLDSRTSLSISNLSFFRVRLCVHSFLFSSSFWCAPCLGPPTAATRIVCELWAVNTNNMSCFDLNRSYNRTRARSICRLLLLNYNIMYSVVSYQCRVFFFKWRISYSLNKCKHEMVEKHASNDRTQNVCVLLFATLLCG